MKTTLFAIFALLATPALHAGGIYKWVDENGVTHYGDKPVKNAETVTLKSTPSPGTPEPMAANATDAERELYCNMANIMLSRINRGDIAGMTIDENENGNSRPMTPDDIPLARELWRNVTQRC